MNNVPLPPRETTLAQILSEEGYLTVAVPKLDLGCEKGFNSIIPMAVPQPKDGEQDSCEEELGHPTTLITQAAMEWLKGEATDGPWFLWVDYESTHEPWRPPEPYAFMFDEEYEGPDVSGPRMYEPDMSKREVNHVRSLYDGEVSFVDKNLGRIIGVMEENGVLKNTLVVLVADHGVFLGEHSLFKKPPFLYDPLIRSTLILSWPCEIPPRTKVHSLSHICDVMPTVLDLVGLPIPKACQGMSLAQDLRGMGKERQAIFTEFCEYKGTAVKAVRTERWKYIYYRSVGNIPWSGDYSPGEVFRRTGLEKEMLFDLHDDPSESVNVVNSHPEVVATMKSLLIDWMIDTEELLPNI